MNPDLERLVELERTEREISRLQQEVASLPGRMAAIEQKLAQSKARLDAARARIKEDESNKRKHEAEIQAQQGKISKYREQSLEVKTNEQYKALMHEVAFAEKGIRAAEDKILELMLDSEAQEQAVRTAEIELKEEAAEIEKEKAEARAVTAKDEKELAEWNTKRTALRSAIDGDVLRHFERVAKLRGSGVAEVREHKCLACQVMLRPQTYNDVRSSDQIVMCDSCQRVLIYRGDAVVAAAPRSSQAERQAELDREEQSSETATEAPATQ